MPSARWLIAGFFLGVALMVAGVFVVDMRTPRDDTTVPLTIFITGAEEPRQPLGARTHPALGLGLLGSGLVLAAASGLGLRREIRS
jgi:hypothetical protein